MSSPWNAPLQAFVIMPFSKDFLEFYKTTIKATLSQEGINAVRADEFQSSRPFLQEIFKHIDECDLIIGVTSGSNANVTYELGYAAHQNKEAIFMTDDPSSLPSDIAGIHHLLYSKDNPKETSENLKNWVKKWKDSKHQKPGKILTRGEIIENIVDGTFFLQQTRPAPSRENILICLDKSQSLPQSLLYITEEGQSAYLDLCNDPEYVYYHETTNIIAGNIEDISNIIINKCGNSGLDFISIGPGNGKKDAMLIEKLCSKVSQGQYVYYYPFDISSGFLLESMRSVLSKNINPTKYRVKAIESDVAHLATFKRVFDFRKEPNVYSLLGGLANSGNEITLLKTINKIMNGEDLFICEVRKKNQSTNDDAIGQTRLNQRLDLAPLKYVGAEFDSNTVTYKEVTSHSTIQGTKTIAGKIPSLTLDDRVFDNVELFNIDYYEKEPLLSALYNAGFNVIKQYESTHAMLFIAEKRNA